MLVERAPSGSCLIKTDCHGQDTSSLEFAFNCWSRTGDIYRHSYGRGEFDEHETFDTEVQCDQCHAPSATAMSPSSPPKPAVMSAAALASSVTSKNMSWRTAAPIVPAAATVRATEASNATTKPSSARSGTATNTVRQTAPIVSEISRYGPKECVSTWRNAAGHCMVQTACESVDVSNYEFGIICVDAKGGKQRHTFGRGSFDAVETFDTLAQCSKCEGTDDPRIVAERLQKKQWEHSAEVSEVATLSDEVKTLTEGLSGMLGVLKKLQQKVDAKHATTPSPSVVATLAAWSGQANDISVDSNSLGGDAAVNHSSPAVAPSPPPLLLRGARSKELKKKHSHHAKEAAKHHKSRHHRRHHRRKRVKVADVQHMMKSSSDDIESVSTDLTALDEMDAEASELELASAGAASEGFQGGDAFEVGTLDDGTAYFGGPW